MPGSDIRVKAGTQRQIVRIMQAVPSAQTGMSGARVNWIPFAGDPTQPGLPLWGEIAPASSRETIRDGQEISQTMVPITTRWIPSPSNPNVLGVTSGMRIQRMQSTQGVYYVTDTYVIQGIVNVDKRNWKVTFACVAEGASN